MWYVLPLLFNSKFNESSATVCVQIAILLSNIVGLGSVLKWALSTMYIYHCLYHVIFYVAIVYVIAIVYVYTNNVFMLVTPSPGADAHLCYQSFAE